MGVGGKADPISLWSGFSAFSPVLLVYQIDDGRIQPDRIPTCLQYIFNLKSCSKGPILTIFRGLADRHLHGVLSIA